MSFAQRPSIATCAAHLVLAGVTGWSLKQLPSGANDTSKNAPAFMFMLLLFLLAHSLLGIFRYSHPDPHKNLRRLYDLSTLLTMLGPVPLLTTQIYLKWLPQGSHQLGYNYLLLSVLVPFVIGCLYSELSQRHKITFAVTTIGLLNVIVLTWISGNTENLWGIGLAISYGMKLFALPKLAERYAVAFVDLHTYGLVFFEIFAVNVAIDAELYRAEWGIVQ